MPQLFFNRQQISAPEQHIARQGMSKQMGINPLINARPGNNGFD